MKPIKANRFTKKRPEEISFSGGAMLENPQKGRQSPAPVAKKKQRSKQTSRPNVRSNERTNVQAIFRYRIEIPRSRRKIRHSFDIFEDQKKSLEKLQLAIAEQEGKRPSLGEMVQEALDQFTKQKGKKLGNTEIIAQE